MGIPGLHPKIANATVPCHLKRFFGRVAAVDTSAWIHRCWQVSGSPSASVRFVLRRVELLHRLNIKPLMILDGRTPQAKEEEVARRTGGHCPPPKRLILRSLVKKFRKMRVDYLVSPFEADGQLAFVEKVEMADLIITEDGDTVVPGCTNIFFKMNAEGEGFWFTRSLLYRCVPGFTSESFNFTGFVFSCVAAGSDYMKSPYGVGIVTCLKVLQQFPQVEDMDEFILMLRGNVPQIEEQDEEEYRQRFLRAVQMFQHQIVVDVVEKRLVPVSAVDVGVVPFADEYFGDELGMEVAKGNVDLNTMRAVDDFDPSAAENFGQDRTSIWHPNYDPTKRIQHEMQPLIIPPFLPRKFKCTRCQKGFKTREKLLLHLATPHPKLFHCLLCNYSCYRSGTLLRHTRGVHQEERPFQCPLCQRRMKIGANLDTHIRWHAGGRNFKCHLCSFLFTNKGNMQVHIALVHEKKKDVVCGKCGADFGRKSDLKVHDKAKHQGVKFPCPRCGEEFTAQSSVSNHIKAVHEKIKDFQCDVCGSSFAKKAHLDRHTKGVHLNLRPFACDCGSTFANASHLKRHKAQSCAMQQ
ncbi:exonuclease 1-like [Folsomia candida]|uniref:exonuclease 1-like n=1 Tax=Folsomia candida TaxID=158441 RepID=UPI0016051869|nr:exonuclease 1-like [Folsomia candida]